MAWRWPTDDRILRGFECACARMHLPEWPEGGAGRRTRVKCDYKPADASAGVQTCILWENSELF